MERKNCPPGISRAGVGPHRHNSDCVFSRPVLHSAGSPGPGRPPYGAAVNDQKASGDEPAVSSPDLTVAMALGSKAQLPFYIVGIGASAGGLQALEEFFDSVNPDSGMAYVVVQHLSPDHTSL